ncbi:MAG: agmatine deiminase family protein [Xanthomonadales bacterium]|nr:agmatine deiminase family protein [Xanthomonadales bacterium]
MTLPPGRGGWQAGVLAAALLLLTAPAAQSFESGDKPGGGALLPDIGGPLERVVISVNSARRSTLRNAELVTHLVNGLPQNSQVLILTNDRAAFTTASGHWPERLSFVELPADNPITMWTQDPFLVLGRPDGDAGVTLLKSKTFDRSGDAAMAGHVARRAGYEVRSSGLYFEGGNVVSDQQFVLIGANTIRYNALKLELSEPEVVLRFEAELGRRVLVVGPFPQPIAHIDMMLTPLGGGRIAVGDSRMGAELAEAALRESPAEVEAFEEFCEDQFFGHPSIASVRGPDGELISAPEIRGKTGEMAEISRSIAPVLDGIAGALAQHGYRVERIPLLYGGPERDREGPGERDFSAAYPMLTYNNVLITGADVYLPRYGWSRMDRAAADMWSSLGFDPRPIEGLTISAMYGGALRCSVKVLERARPADQ